MAFVKRSAPKREEIEAEEVRSPQPGVGRCSGEAISQGIRAGMRGVGFAMANRTASSGLSSAPTAWGEAKFS